MNTASYLHDYHDSRITTNTTTLASMAFRFLLRIGDGLMLPQRMARLDIAHKRGFNTGMHYLTVVQKRCSLQL